MTLEAVAYEVGTALDQAGIVAVLAGGGAATFYAPEAYQTKDLDFVLPFVFSMPSEETILSLGFLPTRTRGTYARAGTPFTLEFIDGPLAISDEIIETWDTLRDGVRVLNVISPTDCVRDRLAAAIHWRDEASIQQAVAVARRHPVDRARIKAWCAAEGGAKVYERFASQVR